MVHDVKPVLAASVLEIVTAGSALIAALGVSGLLGARWQAERDRQERMRERMLNAADEFVTATMAATSIIQRAAATGGQKRGDLLNQAQAGYQAAYGHVGRLAFLFPPRREGSKVSSAHDPAIEVMNAIGAAMRAVTANAPLEQVTEALGRVGDRQGAFARYVNNAAWSRQLKPPKRLTSK